MPYISVVTPVYNAVNIVEELHHRLVEHLEAITDDFEIIMVNDACPYGSGEKIAEIAAKDPRVKFMELARNFGQHIAISAGLDYAEGEYVVVMDCDLQDPPHKPFLPFANTGRTVFLRRPSLMYSIPLCVNSLTGFTMERRVQEIFPLSRIE